ncbi:hypothetical protein HELRODRAFT_74403 [Helobdella robusta]|uniref:RNA helicase n=1 Tax=Helobdella robusta TaxID=6412 RepID=T1G1Q5_HELRO|nr:hypothetical protein HELRODRAFT_74403 [Helobdella robusta]ESO08894.1 hypothetical protein HELRODRAFT_74403 [Helobdella robusta]
MQANQSLPLPGCDEASPKKCGLELRGYQIELASDAIKGRNCIIVAPTGTGKTHVAMFIIKASSRRKKKKVMFVVPTVALVEQQKRLFEKYLHADVIGISGDVELSLTELLETHTLFVLTPQILENLLRKESSHMLELSLLIFDECHHTKKEHPYNAIMARYHEHLDLDPNSDLPQIVGLTASIGVGKAKDSIQAMDYILGVCANLNTYYITTVTKNVQELSKATNKPVEETEECSGRKYDPFGNMINEVMSNIEMMIQMPPKGNDDDVEGDDDQIVQWHLCYIRPEDEAIFCIMLSIYNNALMINADCRTKDAVNFIRTKVGEFEDTPTGNSNNQTTISLMNNWQSTSVTLPSYHQNDFYDNPKLELIKSKLIKQYKQNEDSRCIMFCKTRDMTVALKNWMNETEELKSLNATNLVGTNAPAYKAGQTSAQQEDVLKYFKNGKHKLIIATTVAEEGLDVQKCNLVLRYEHVTNSIARVQCRGRARAENAASCLIAERGRGIAMKEKINEIRERMMTVAIKRIQEMNFEERRRCIKTMQHRAKASFQYISEELKKIKLHQNLYEIRCSKCDSLGSLSDKVRKIENSHHVVIDPSMKDRVIIKPYPQTENISPTFERSGKIYCKECNSDWGIMASYNGVSFPVIKVCGHGFSFSFMTSFNF